MAEAVGLARLHESKLTEAKRSWSRSTGNRFSPSSSTATQTLALLLAPSTTARLPIKRLTPAEMQSRWDKGLCYNCGERFSPGHRCKTCQLFLLLYNDDDVEGDPESGVAVEPPAEPPPEEPSVQSEIPNTIGLYIVIVGNLTDIKWDFGAAEPLKKTAALDEREKARKAEKDEEVMNLICWGPNR
ncbi:hypothetical protein NE237_032804 [Protea cynaroides]|uniref:Uncharacterized protein n=1 Tax=Protea cynaroides TaxID=273540 RepID=A0A9Q0L3T0_9MAGN|nr:hypothetical protein NE237_032804 [Protea cynaroides]